MKKNIATNFHNKKVPKEKIPSKCLSITMLDSVEAYIKHISSIEGYIEAYIKCYPQTFLEECKYVQENIKFENYINDNLDSDSDDDNDNNDEYEE